jgi:hypothetical protein
VNRKDLEGAVANMGRFVKEICPPGTGYILLLFDFGATGNLAYLSTCDRAQAIAVMKEWIRKMETA